MARVVPWPGTNFETHGNSFCRELNDTPLDSMFFFRRGDLPIWNRFEVARTGIDATIQRNIRGF